MMSVPSERRRLQRVTLLQPLPGRIGAQRIFILDLSRTGLRIAHQEAIGAPGEQRTIEFEWDCRRVALECTLRHSHVQRRIQHSGFTIVAPSPESEEVLREIIASHVERALDEQKANARGIPAISARSFQTGNAREYVRHVCAAGRWHAAPTPDVRQPVNGFTISAAQSASEVAMLRAAWEAGDGPARAMIQKLAELSVSRAEGIPTRRYTP
jgi:hypothetical protein